MSTVLPASHYGDPLKILLAEERKTCKGCIHRTFAWGIHYCAKDENKTGSKLRPCKFYREG